MLYKSLVFRLLLLFSFSFLSFNSAFADQVIDQGKALFKANCAQCHNRNMKDDLTGPALGGVQDRWESEELLYSWIRNSQAVIASGNEYANSVYNRFNKSPMNPFPNLKDEEIASILAYINCMYVGDPACTPKPVNGGGTAATGPAESSKSIFCNC